MLQLTADQTNALQAIKRTRDLRALREGLTASFPEVAARAGERLDALIAHGVQRGGLLGLTHLVAIARYLACWFMLGAEFEARPEFAWAGEILTPPRPQGRKIFQLCRRTREELSRLAQAAPLPAPSFDAALKTLDTELMARGLIGSLLPAEPLKLGQPCDIDALELRLMDAPADQAAQPYRFENGSWQRGARAASAAPLLLTGGVPLREPAPALPERLHLLGTSRLRVRSRADQCCEGGIHPLVSHSGPQGLRHWRGAHASELALQLPAPVIEAAPMRMAIESSPQLHLLSAESCGLRESGQPMGEQSTQLAVYAAEQQLMVWRRDPLPMLEFPGASEPTAASTRCRIERDGVALDAKAWLAGFADLDRQLFEGLSRLSTAWERTSGVTGGKLQAEPALFSGSAGLTWGFDNAAPELTAAPYFRVAGMLDLIASQPRLHFTGALSLHGSQSRLTLDCSAAEPLQASFERKAAEADVAAALKPAQIQFRQPFVLQIDAIAQADPPALAVMAAPLAGAIVGACGLRASPEGPGLQWFCELRVEAVSAVLLIHDPIIGQTTVIRPLLPAMKLVDWSL
ncbi:MAG TPA: hypothetical protein VGM81_00850 [Burkholderiaceae bacterium]|jgi:hypothetical protein